MQRAGAMIPPLDDAADHLRGPAGRSVILVYGDYECPYTRRAYREVQRVERTVEGGVRFAYRHFPLSDVHPHAVAAAGAAEAAAAQERFWEMHDMLFHRQKALADEDLGAYAGELGLDLDRFEQDRVGADAVARIRRDFDGALASGLVQGTPTIFIDGAVYDGGYEADALVRVLSG